MKTKNPYQIIKKRLVSEKSNLLETLKNMKSNKSISRFKKSKYVFLVDPKANKQKIKEAIEEIYKNKKITVESVNTIILKPKRKFFRGTIGKTKLKKKAIITLKEGDSIDEKKG